MNERTSCLCLSLSLSFSYSLSCSLCEKLLTTASPHLIHPPPHCLPRCLVCEGPLDKVSGHSASFEAQLCLCPHHSCFISRTGRGTYPTLGLKCSSEDYSLQPSRTLVVQILPYWSGLVQYRPSPQGRVPQIEFCTADAVVPRSL